uniref:Abnormal cell migration protein 18-like fibronectin type I domain-containing protein n=1 Tax=Plectus sambesii TaxID=2011161 RepID=A0A914WY97_9BILA
MPSQRQLLALIIALVAVAEGAHHHHRKGRKHCTMNGEKHALGEEWTVGHLHYKCNSDGFEIIGCMLSSGKLLKVGHDLVKDNTAFRCFRSGESTYYREYTCGVVDMPSCILEPITDETSGIGGFRPQIVKKMPVVIGHLPRGWTILDNHGKRVKVAPDTTGIISEASPPGIAPPPEFSTQ